MQNHLEMTTFLIDQGARVNATNGLGEYGFRSFLSTALPRPSNSLLTRCTSHLRSPLHRAIQLAKDLRITSLLLARGADLGTLTMDRKTPLHTFFNPVVEYALQVTPHSTLTSYLPPTTAAAPSWTTSPGPVRPPPRPSNWYTCVA